jgi:hypothetical protein
MMKTTDVFGDVKSVEVKPDKPGEPLPPFIPVYVGDVEPYPLNLHVYLDNAGVMPLDQGSDIATTITPFFDPAAIQMFEEYKRLQVKNGRLAKKLIKTRKQRDHWQAEHDKIKAMTQLYPYMQSTIERYNTMSELRAINKDLVLTLEATRSQVRELTRELENARVSTANT